MVYELEWINKETGYTCYDLVDQIKETILIG